MKHIPDFKPDGDSIQAIASERTPLLVRTQVLAIGAVVGFVALVALILSAVPRDHAADQSVASPSPGGSNMVFRPSPEQWATLESQPAEYRLFRKELTTEGRIAIDEDRATPIYSPFAGRIIRLLAKPGDIVAQGQPLLTLEVADAVQMRNDLVAAVSALKKARSQLALAQIVQKRQSDLYAGNAVPLKDMQQAENDLSVATADLQSAESAYQASRNRLRLIGKTEDEINTFEVSRTVSGEAAIFAPLGGIVLQRKAGPGQFISSGSSDPLFMVGDLQTVWVVANIREADAAQVRIGQDIEVSPIGLPGELFKGKINYVSATVDPVTRRIPVRATIDNAAGQLKLEMFATVTVVIDQKQSIGVPRDAIIYDGEQTRVWIVSDDRQSVHARQITTGLADARLVEIDKGVNAGEQVVSKGALRIDRAAAGRKS
jgi:cobalt-zinc-cadmium efflux system membrane fusion protein